MKKTGFTLIELLIVVAILAIISAITIGSIRNHLDSYALKQTSDDVAALLERGHHRSKNSYNDSQHSVRVETSQAILYEGTSYNAADPDNEVVEYNERVSLGSATLAGGGSTITFNKVTGATDDYGSVKLILTHASTSSSTIYIGETGIIEVR